jgi:hypothetical protein
MTRLHQTRNSATESIPASRLPLWGNQWAVTPKLTMIAGRQLSIEGAFGAKAPFSIKQ